MLYCLAAHRIGGIVQGICGDGVMMGSYTAAHQIRVRSRRSTASAIADKNARNDQGHSVQGDDGVDGQVGASVTFGCFDTVPLGGWRLYRMDTTDTCTVQF